jgi:hypothetical protein
MPPGMGPFVDTEWAHWANRHQYSPSYRSFHIGSSAAIRTFSCSLSSRRILTIASLSYYSLVEVIYESFVLSAFLLLVIQYVAKTSANRTAEGALARKDKTKLIIPVCKGKLTDMMKWLILL